MVDGYINAYHHKSRHAGEFSFNASPILGSRFDADVYARSEEAIEPCTRRVGVWRVMLKEGVRE